MNSTKVLVGNDMDIGSVSKLLKNILMYCKLRIERNSGHRGLIVNKEDNDIKIPSRLEIK